MAKQEGKSSHLQVRIQTNVKFVPFVVDRDTRDFNVHAARTFMESKMPFVWSVAKMDISCVENSSGSLDWRESFVSIVVAKDMWDINVNGRIWMIWYETKDGP